MKRILLILLAVVLVIGVFAAAGYTGSRLGFAQGRETAADGGAVRPGLRLFDGDGPRGLRNFGMDRTFHREFGMGGFPMRGLGLFAPLLFLIQIAALALIVWFLYWLFTRSSWRLTRTAPVVEPQPTSTETETKE